MIQKERVQKSGGEKKQNQKEKNEVTWFEDTSACSQNRQKKKKNPLFFQHCSKNFTETLFQDRKYLGSYSVHTDPWCRPSGNDFSSSARVPIRSSEWKPHISKNLHACDSFEADVLNGTSTTAEFWSPWGTAAVQDEAERRKIRCQVC